MMTRSISGINYLIIPGLFFILFTTCEKENEQLPGEPPVLTTANVTNITPVTASCGGYITSDGGEIVSSRGVCWSKDQNPTLADDQTTDGSGAGTFTSTITGLTATTTYYVRAYATNNTATSYGNEMVFKTYTGTVTDVEGNMYNTIDIAAQTWMAENLKTTKYNDNTAIPLVADRSAWTALFKPGYCWYDNDSATYRAAFGALYNWYAVDLSSNGDKNVCPAGWHVPTDAEWTTLTTFLGGENVAGGKMKAAGTAFWQSPNAGANNESGFSALPGGGRYYDGAFSAADSIGGWWTSTELLSGSARGRYLYYNYSFIYRGSGSKQDAFSVRCVKD